MSNFLLLKSLMPSTHGSPRSTVQRKNGCTCETPVTEIHHLFCDVLTWNMWRTMLICQPFSLEIWISHVSIFVQTFFQSSKTFFFGNLTEKNWLILVFCIIFLFFLLLVGSFWLLTLLQHLAQTCLDNSCRFISLLKPSNMAPAARSLVALVHWNSFV